LHDGCGFKFAGVVLETLGHLEQRQASRIGQRKRLCQLQACRCFLPEIGSVHGRREMTDSSPPLRSEPDLQRKLFTQDQNGNSLSRQRYQSRRNSSGSLAILLAILRASSLVSSLAADRRPGSSS